MLEAALGKKNNPKENIPLINDKIGNRVAGRIVELLMNDSEFVQAYGTGREELLGKAALLRYRYVAPLLREELKNSSADPEKVEEAWAKKIAQILKSEELKKTKNN